MAHSQNFDNDVVIRGKWIYQNLLAGVIPDVPIEVDATVPADHDKSLRQRMEKTREAYCWKCHRKMNSYGLVLESYDDVGRYRTEELLRDNKTTVPVVTTGAIVASGEPKLDGPVKDVKDLMHKLANSDRARQSFIRHVFRYYMGRNETLDDSPTLIAADKAYQASGGSMKALVASLLSSDSFMYRKDIEHGSVAKRNSPAAKPAATPVATVRRFHNADRSKSFEAVFIEFDAGTRKVKMRHNDGRVLTFAIEHLHADDQTYVMSQSK